MFVLLLDGTKYHSLFTKNVKKKKKNSKKKYAALKILKLVFFVHFLISSLFKCILVEMLKMFYFVLFLSQSARL